MTIAPTIRSDTPSAVMPTMVRLLPPGPEGSGRERATTVAASALMVEHRGVCAAQQIIGGVGVDREHGAADAGAQTESVLADLERILERPGQAGDHRVALAR